MDKREPLNVNDEQDVQILIDDKTKVYFLDLDIYLATDDAHTIHDVYELEGGIVVSLYDIDNDEIEKVDPNHLTLESF